jgi:hypothetical protein
VENTGQKRSSALRKSEKKLCAKNPFHGRNPGLKHTYTDAIFKLKINVIRIYYIMDLI